MLDVQHSRIHVHLAVPSEGGAVLPGLEARLACAGASLSLQSMLDGLAVQVGSRLLGCCWCRVAAG